MREITIIKLNTNGEEVWRYEGRKIKQDQRSILVEAFFNRSDLIFHGICLKQGDRFIELYLNDRWYNIFEIYDRDDQGLKGWYCNIASPCWFKDDQILYMDLALDLLVYPNGDQLVLDEDEFAALDIEEGQKKCALSALAELQKVFRNSPSFRLAE